MTGTASTSPGTPCAGDEGTPALSLANQHAATERNANSPRPSPRAAACPLPRCRNLQMPAIARGETERFSLTDGVGPPRLVATQGSPRRRPPPPRTGARPPAGPLGASGQRSHPARHQCRPTWGPAALPPPCIVSPKQGGTRQLWDLDPSPSSLLQAPIHGKKPSAGCSTGRSRPGSGQLDSEAFTGSFLDVLLASPSPEHSPPQPACCLVSPHPRDDGQPAPPPSDFVFLRLIPTSFPFIWVLEALCTFRPFICTTNPSLRTSPPEKTPELSHPCRQRGSIPIRTQEGAWAKPRSPLLGRDVGMLPAQQGRNRPARGRAGRRGRRGAVPRLWERHLK